MILPNTSPRNPYYFVNSSVIFKIAYQNPDSDSCAKHYKTFDTESKELKKDQYYIDLHGDVTKAPSDGNYDVSKETADGDSAITANKAVFPWFEVGYSYNVKNKDGEEVTKTGTQIYWLDNLIEDGDKMNGSKFEKKTVHASTSANEDQVLYTTYYKNLLLEEMAKDFQNGYTKTQIEKKYALFIVGQTANINGIKGEVTSVTASNKITDSNIQDAIKKAIKEYGNKLLKDYDKHVSDVTVTSGAEDSEEVGL